MLKKKINEDYMIAFKEKNTQTKNLLSVVKGEIQTQEKNTGVEDLSDEAVIKIINKIAKSLREQLIIDNPVITQAVREELAIIEVYLPKQMSNEEITTKVSELIADGAINMGEIMKAFSGLQADKKTVSQVYQELTK
jgi:uncharacterized protein YqeY